MKIKFNKQIGIGLISVLLGLLAGAVMMVITGNNPIEGYSYLFRGGLMNLERIGNTLASATPLVFTGLAVGFAFKTGLFNIGASGQMLIGGLCATAVGLTFNLPRVPMLIAVVLAAIIGGGLWAVVPGYLKAKFNVNEVVSTIMMNWISYWVVYYSVPAYFKGPFLETESRNIPDVASLKTPWLTSLFDGSFVNIGLFLAILAVIIIGIILNNTVLGFELKAAGYNRFSAEYAGMKVNRNIVLSMVISGMLAGLGGATYYVGYASNMQIGVLPTQGFDGIAVALLGANNPYGAFAAAIFFGILHSGKGFMNAMTSIPPEIGDIIIAFIIYLTATSVLIERVMTSISKKIKGGK